MQAFSITDIGKVRNLNQDYTFVSLDPVGILPNLFMVADGMGGHNGGEFASKYTVEYIERSIRESKEDEPQDIMAQAIQGANAYIRQMAGSNPYLDGMGTTLVIASVIGGKLYAGNVGDSRLYIVNGKEINQVTRDHSLVSEMVRAGTIDREDARKHPKKNIITRAVGADERIYADFFFRDMEKGDVIVICSDGLTNMVEDEEICSIAGEDRNIEERCRQLVDKANDCGGKDNIAVVLVEPEI